MTDRIYFHRSLFLSAIRECCFNHHGNSSEKFRKTNHTSIPTFTERDFNLLSWAMIAFQYLPIENEWQYWLSLFDSSPLNLKAQWSLRQSLYTCFFVPYRPLYYRKHPVNNGLVPLAKSRYLNKWSPNSATYKCCTMGRQVNFYGWYTCRWKQDHANLKTIWQHTSRIRMINMPLIAFVEYMLKIGHYL